jgi:acyl-coenzyme A thioesterase PaaI-like protein
MARRDAESRVPSPGTDPLAPRPPGLKQRLLPWLLRFYPPLLGAGIRVSRPAPGRFAVRMPLTFWNRNYVGTQFGGSLYSMCDPFFMLILLEKLGPGYLVWDKAATIRFRRPGRGTVRAEFAIPDETVESIRARVDGGEVVEPVFEVAVTDADDKLVAEVEKVLWVKKKPPA